MQTSDIGWAAKSAFQPPALTDQWEETFTPPYYSLGMAGGRQAGLARQESSGTFNDRLLPPSEQNTQEKESERVLLSQTLPHL